MKTIYKQFIINTLFHNFQNNTLTEQFLVLVAGVQVGSVVVTPDDLHHFPVGDEDRPTVGFKFKRAPPPSFTFSFDVEEVLVVPDHQDWALRASHYVNNAT